jgi:hypothetical protein
MSTQTRVRPRRRLSPGARRAALTGHILVSVGLLGDVSAFLAIAIHAAATSDPAVAATSYASWPPSSWCSASR